MRVPVPRLRLALLSAVIVSVVIVVSVVSWFIILQYRDEALHHVHHYALTVAANVASAETDSIITENFASLQDCLTSFQNQVHVRSLTIATPEGIIISDSHPERIGEHLSLPSGFEENSEAGSIDVNVRAGRASTILPIKVGETIIGWCSVVLDISYIQQTLLAIQKKILTVTGVSLLVISGLILWFSTAITRPIEDMVIVAKKVADGNFDQQARVAGVYEIRRLAEVFNMMSRAIEEREQRLRQAQKMEAIGVLSSSIAHEFGNPLMGISFLLDDLRENPCLDNENRRLLDMGLEECNRMKKLIRDLKQFYRPSSGEITSVHIEAVIEDILLFQRAFLNAANVEVVRKYHGHLPPVQAVADQIKQVLVNLLLNAVESMGEDGGTVTISTAVEDDRVVIAIRDTGTGISPGEQEKVFHPFYSTKPEVAGTGLGLSISYGIVKKHNGEIRVHSKPGQGTTFTVILPIG